MTEAERDIQRRESEFVASAFAAMTGSPLFVTPTMAKQMREAGYDMTNVRETQAVPSIVPLNAAWTRANG